MTRAVMIAVAMLAACDRAPLDDASFQQAARDLAEVERVELRDQQRISDLSTSARTLRARARHLADDWSQITAELRVATAAYERARLVGEQAAQELDEAAKTYAQAAREFRTVATIILIAAASDALGSEICGQTTSTRAFREKLRAEGTSLDGVDVDHVWPRALGGADHPLNYQLLDSSLNRSLGAGVLDKIANQPFATLQGFVVSALAALRCG